MVLDIAVGIVVGVLLLSVVLTVLGFLCLIIEAIFK